MVTSAEWYAMPVLRGTLIRLEPLTVEHAAGYHAAATREDAVEVFRWLNVSVPDSPEQALQQITDALAARARGARLPYAQLDVQTGEFAGTTSFYEVEPTTRSLGIGHTWLARRWWRSGRNTESKLLMMTHAFEVLGAVRVVWHTDIRNSRSQDAIARLGATREGVLRKHRLRRDGSWRDSVQYAMTDEDWPMVCDRLSARLGRG